ncbi:receptor-like protein kinase FERONIA [Mercurialis annua]|uniref:receptor-like protein kinase FERONIA n=1 Tax=Mercurialis annua TaxID=3986 RepID=UPI00215E805C|nr:receptor-like protein kinase FERONIA [Mercurialis annua]
MIFILSNLHSNNMRITSNNWFVSLIYISLLQCIFFQVAAVSSENIAIDCGSPTDSEDISERMWKSDTNSNFSLVDHNNSSIISPAIQPPRQVYAAPYATARLSRTQFTYSFPVVTGQKFIRLHFYPAFYGGFNRSDAFFSVKAGRFTLLSNFSAALHAEAQDLEGFFKEFCLNVAEEDEQKLNIDFIPSPYMPDSYAFINGIEIVSMPLNLYYSKPSDRGVGLVGQDNQQNIESSSALALIYRINVGGSSISPKNDSGNMFRSWSGEDEKYLTIDQSSVRPFNLTIELSFGDQIANYSAPANVYTTARSMGMDGAINQQYNLTWEFPVDSDFTYFIRLHFCEIETPIQVPGDRVFRIYINDDTAERSADVIMWSGGYGFPVYKDYAVMMTGNRDQKRQNLSVALQALSPQQTHHSDAILNGIEIFKLSTPLNNLAGPNPDIAFPPNDSPASAISPKPKNKWTKIGALIGGVLSGVVVLATLFFFIFRRSSKTKDSGNSISSAKSGKTQGSTLPCDLCRRFSLSEIRDATNNFDSLFIVGVGGFGNVYKGLINEGAISVAIKQLNPGSEQGAHEFKTEIEMLSQLRYLHLVSLIGYCYEDGEMILVYDYMAKGTLRDHLYKTDNPPLPWIQRLKICIGAAHGLQYLHSGAKNSIIHRDVKSTNILLDDKWVAKVSDFGLSKFGPNSMSKPHISTVVKGSIGYLDPEYFHLQRLTEKSDVYSFGVVLCEVLSAKPPVSRTSVSRPVSLAEWARQCYRNGKLEDLVDPYLKGKIAPDCLKNFFELAVSCLVDNGMDRPSMNDVVWRLEFALDLQKTAVKQCVLEPEIDKDMERPLKESSHDDSSNNFSSDSGLVIGSRLSGMTLTSSSDDQSFRSNFSDQKVTSGAVFSQIMNPEAR